jgi:hypothetical protein
MAALTNTLTTYDVGASGGNREELADRIFDISPEETPTLSMIGKENVKSVHPEWLIDTLEEGDTDNAYPQGDEYEYDAVSVPSRVGNYTQISRESFIISKTQEETDKAGRKSEIAREIRRKGLKLRFSMEGIILSNQASLAGNFSTPGKLGGFPAWLTSNALRGSGGSDGGFNSSTGVVDAATNGSQRAFSKTLLDELCQTVNNSGGNVKNLMVSNYVKTVFSGLMNTSATSQVRTNLAGNEQGTITSAADMYVSDFGVVKIIPNRRMTKLGAAIARNAFMIDPEYVKLGVFRPIQQDKPTRTGDAEKRVMITEYTLLCKNEAAHGVIADLYGMTASS